MREAGERRAARRLAPLDAEDLEVEGSRTRAVWLPFPGIHRTQLRMEPRDPAGDGAE